MPKFGLVVTTSPIISNRGESHYDPSSASELATDRPDEYIFLFNYVEDVTALVGNCQVTIMPSLQQIKRMDHDYPDLELADFVDAALEIGRTSLLALRRRLPAARVPREMDPHWLDGVSDSAAGRIGVSAAYACGAPRGACPPDACPWFPRPTSRRTGTTRTRIPHRSRRRRPGDRATPGRSR